MAAVIRDGKPMTCNAADLVRGDIIECKFGDRVPADIRVLHASGFKVRPLLISSSHLISTRLFLYS